MMLEGAATLREKTYHHFDSITTRPSDGNAGATFGSIIPHIYGQRGAEEVAGESIAPERAGPASHIAAVKGGFT